MIIPLLTLSPCEANDIAMQVFADRERLMQLWLLRVIEYTQLSDNLIDLVLGPGSAETQAQLTRSHPCGLLESLHAPLPLGVVISL